MPNVAEIQKLFLSSRQFAVVGASKDQNKYGAKVLRWYKDRDLSVTPVHPREDELEGIKTVHLLSELSAPSETAVSIITPPKVTLGILESAKELNVPALWLQPGAEDDSVQKYIVEAGLADRVIFGGPCILVQGDDVIKNLIML